MCTDKEEFNNLVFLAKSAEDVSSFVVGVTRQLIKTVLQQFQNRFLVKSSKKYILVLRSECLLIIYFRKDCTTHRITLQFNKIQISLCMTIHYHEHLCIHC